jgi:hypothetical protein
MSQRTLTYTVSVTFADNIYDDAEIVDVAKNIARAIIAESTDGEGIAPAETDNYLESVKVKPEHLDSQVFEKVI